MKGLGVIKLLINKVKKELWYTEELFLEDPEDYGASMGDYHSAHTLKEIETLEKQRPLKVGGTPAGIVSMNYYIGTRSGDRTVSVSKNLWKLLIPRS